VIKLIHLLIGPQDPGLLASSCCRNLTHIFRTQIASFFTNLNCAGCVYSLREWDTLSHTF